MVYFTFSPLADVYLAVVTLQLSNLLLANPTPDTRISVVSQHLGSMLYSSSEEIG
jgi:hypothetical protein